MTLFTRARLLILKKDKQDQEQGEPTRHKPDVRTMVVFHLVSVSIERAFFHQNSFDPSNA